MKTFKHYLQESEHLAENPAVGDGFDIEIAREEIVLETTVVDIVEDGIVIEADETMMRILMHVGYLIEHSNMPPAQESTSPLSGRKDVYKEFKFQHSADTDLEEQQGISDPRARSAFDELDAAISASKSGQAATTNSLEKYADDVSRRAQTGQLKGKKWSEMSPIEQEELRRQGFGPKPSVNEDYKNPVASAVLHRIMMQHPGVLATHGPEHVMQAVDELADTVGDVEEIGSSDVSAWTREVIRMLAELPDEPLDENDFTGDVDNRGHLQLSPAGAAKVQKHPNYDPNLSANAQYSTHFDDKGYQRMSHAQAVEVGKNPKYNPNLPANAQWDLLNKSTTAPTNEAKYRGREVPLGKKMAGDVKKSKVYVRKPNGNVVKVEFGDPNMTIKKSNPKRRKSFRARHNCDNPGPRHKARYWSCRSW